MSEGGLKNEVIDMFVETRRTFLKLDLHCFKGYMNVSNSFDFNNVIFTFNFEFLILSVLIVSYVLIVSFILFMSSIGDLKTEVKFALLFAIKVQS